MSSDVRPDRLARWISPTLGIGVVDLLLGLELALSGNVNNSTFVTASGGKYPAAALLAAVGCFTIWGTIRGDRTRRYACFVNILFWVYITATLLQRSSDTATLIGPTLTGGYALCSILRYMQLKGLRRERGNG